MDIVSFLLNIVLLAVASHIIIGIGSLILPKEFRSILFVSAPLVVVVAAVITRIVVENNFTPDYILQGILWYFVLIVGMSMSKQAVTVEDDKVSSPDINITNVSNKVYYFDNKEKSHGTKCTYCGGYSKGYKCPNCGANK